MRRGQESYDCLILRREGVSYHCNGSENSKTFSVVPSDRKRGDGHKWKSGKFHFNIRKNLTH